MISGIGVDIIQVNRIKKAIENSGDGFINKVFTKGEQECCREKKNIYQHLAARFAGKEAVLKAFNLGWSSVDWKSIEIENDATGAPRVILHNRMKEICDEKYVDKIFFSLSHFGSYAVAVVILQTWTQNE